MDIFSKVGEAAATGGASTAVSAVGTIAGAVFKNKDRKLSHEEFIAELAMKPQTAQHEINKIEAGHRSVFVAGWRPALGWVAAISLFFFYVPQYVVASIVWARAIYLAGEIVAFPVDAEGIMELVLALLGLAGLRTAEKVTGRAK